MEKAGSAIIKVWGLRGMFSCFVDKVSLTETNKTTVSLASANFDSLLI